MDDDDAPLAVRQELADLEAQAVAALYPVASWLPLARVYYHLVRLELRSRRRQGPAHLAILSRLSRFLAALSVRTGLGADHLSPMDHGMTGAALAAYLDAALPPVATRPAKRPGGTPHDPSGGKRRRLRLYTTDQVLALGRRRRQVPCAACGKAIKVCDARLIVFMDGRGVLPLCDHTNNQTVS